MSIPQTPVTSDFKVVEEVASEYIYVPFNPVGGSSATITNSGASISFSIAGGQECWNPAESLLTFSLSIPALGANAVAWFDRLSLHIDRMTVTTSGGARLLDISYLDRMQELVLPITMDLKTFMNQPTGEPDQAAGAASGVTSALTKNNSEPITYTAITNVAATAPRMLKRPDNTFEDVRINGPLYMTTTGVKNQAQAYRVQAKLGDVLPHTFWSINKTIFLGNERLLVDILFAPIGRIYHFTTTAGNGSSARTRPNINQQAAASNIALTSLTFYMAVEKNLDIASSVKALFKKGVSFPVDYPYSARMESTGTSQSFVLPINAGQGQFLKHIYWGPYHATESSNTAHNHSNLADAKVQTYRTYLNGQPLQLNQIDTSEFEDWLLMYPKIKGTVAGQSANTFQFNGVHLDSWTPSDWKSRLSPGENLSGLSVSRNDLQYSYSGTTANATHIYYVFAIFSKMIRAQDGVLTIN